MTTIANPLFDAADACIACVRANAQSEDKALHAACDAIDAYTTNPTEGGIRKRMDGIFRMTAEGDLGSPMLRGVVWSMYAVRYGGAWAEPGMPWSIWTPLKDEMDRMKEAA